MSDNRVEFAIKCCSCPEKFLEKIDFKDYDFKEMLVVCPFCKSKCKVVFEKDDEISVLRSSKD